MISFSLRGRPRSGPACPIPAIALATLATLLLPAAAMAQTCTLKLSQFEAATDAFQADTEKLSRTLKDGYGRLQAIERAMARDPLTCPDTLEASRNSAAGLGADKLVEQSHGLLDCGQYFSQRVLQDIETAKAANDSDLMLRLGEIQKRIFDVEARGIDSIRQATFLDLRAQRLVTEHDMLGSRCALLGSAYD